MPKEFGQWFADVGKGETEELDDSLWLVCTGCGKSDVVSRAEFENGDSGWYSEDPESGEGLCTGSLFCLP